MLKAVFGRLYSRELIRAPVAFSDKDIRVVSHTDYTALHSWSESWSSKPVRQGWPAASSSSWRCSPAWAPVLLKSLGPRSGPLLQDNQRQRRRKGGLFFHWARSTDIGSCWAIAEARGGWGLIFRAPRCATGLEISSLDLGRLSASSPCLLPKTAQSAGLVCVGRDVLALFVQELCISATKACILLVHPLVGTHNFAQPAVCGSCWMTGQQYLLNVRVSTELTDLQLQQHPCLPHQDSGVPPQYEWTSSI